MQRAARRLRLVTASLPACVRASLTLHGGRWRAPANCTKCSSAAEAGQPPSKNMVRGSAEMVGFIGRCGERGMYMWCSSTRASARTRTGIHSLGVSTSSAAFALLTVLLAINHLAPCLPVPHHVPAQRQPKLQQPVARLVLTLRPQRRVPQPRAQRAPCLLQQSP
jgi:hypothetical protein